MSKSSKQKDKSTVAAPKKAPLTPKKTAKKPEKVNPAVVDEVAANPAKKNNKSELILKLATLFKEARETLVSISDTKKQPRQLRFALQQIDMAERAAGRAITHVA